jgi:hypothetical protein
MNIQVIIPVHEFNDKIKDFLDKAIESIVKQESLTKLPLVVLVFPTPIESNIKEFVESQKHKYQNSGVTDQNFYLINNFDKTDYQSQINLAVKSVTTEYFSVLEFDDEYSTTFFRNANKYVESYPDIDIFLTMMIEVNEKNEGIKLTNETVWSQQFVGENGEMGYLNAKSLQQYTDFKLSGAIIKTSEFQNLGGYKSNIKLAFMYELLLRALNNACKIFTIPKIGYKHLSTREGSLFDVYLKTMPIEERKFWFETATKESNIMTDRAIDMSRLKKVVVSEK